MATHEPFAERLERCRVYAVSYVIFGRDKRPLTRIKACVVAMDVGDVVAQIQKSCLGIEITGTGLGGEFFHEVSENIEIESAELIGHLHGITDRAYKIITACDEHEKLDDFSSPEG